MREEILLSRQKRKPTIKYPLSVMYCVLRQRSFILTKTNLGEENYMVSFEGEIEVQAETKVNAENQVYDQLSHLGQVTVEAFKKVQHN